VPPLFVRSFVCFPSPLFGVSFQSKQNLKFIRILIIFARLAAPSEPKCAFGRVWLAAPLRATMSHINLTDRLQLERKTWFRAGGLQMLNFKR
jgi:hypothetical protein